MRDFVELVGPNQALAVFGVKLVGANAENAKKLLFTLVFVCLCLLLVKGLRLVSRRMFHRGSDQRIEFWVRQGINLVAAVLLLFGTISIWFDDPTRLTTAFGLITAGPAFALQKVITAIAGYVVILRGKTFMGQPPPVQKDDPAMWVRSRQYTGRIVTVSNARIFERSISRSIHREASRIRDLVASSCWSI